MIRNLKALGLLAFAAMAMSAMFASGALAQKVTGVATAGETPETHEGAIVVGKQHPEPQESEEAKKEWEEWNFFQPSAAIEDRIQCDTSVFELTTATGTREELEYPTLHHCSAFGQPMTTNLNGCEPRLVELKTLEEGKYTATGALACPMLEGGHARITVDIYGFGNSTNTSHFFKACTVYIYPNEPEEEEGFTVDLLGGHVIVENVDGEPDEVALTIQLEDFTVDRSECPEGGVSEDGLLTGTAVGKAFSDEGGSKGPQIDLWISDVEEE